MKISDADDTLRISAIVRSIAMGVVFSVVGFILGRLLGYGFVGMLLVGLALGIGGGTVVYKITTAVSDGAGAALLSIVQPSGTSTPYARQFSDAEAMAARGDFVGAMAAYRIEMDRHPTNVALRLQAAEVLVRANDHRSAEQLFVEARRLTTGFSEELYATQRLIDLRLGPLAEPERALPELRRIVDRFPNSAEARGARDAIARIKSESRSS